MMLRGVYCIKAVGSGKVTISPSPVEAGATIRKITLTYTANVRSSKRANNAYYEWDCYC